MNQTLTDAITQAKRDEKEALETFLSVDDDPYEWLDEDEVAAVKAEVDHAYAKGFCEGLQFAQRLLTGK